MRLPRLALIGLAAGHVLCAGGAMAQIRVVEWNVTNYGSPYTRDANFKTALYGVAPNGLQLAPDILIIQEVLQGAPGGAANAAQFLSMLNTAPGSPGDWATAPYIISLDTGNAMYYRTSKIQWLGTATLNTDTGTGPMQAPRDTQRWQVRLVGYSGIGAQLYMYGAHFKAGSAPADQERRNPEGRRIRIDSNALPNTANFLLCADLNIQNSSQVFYQWMISEDSTPPAGEEFVADPSGRFFDPINTPAAGGSSVTWENNSTYRYIHTQDPAGQMDSRHDQIIFGANLRDGQGMDYMPFSVGGNVFSPFSLGTWNDPNHSYRCWGNDGSSYNGPLNTSSNAMVGNTIALALVSSAASGGHLPVYIDLQVPAKVNAPVSVAFGSVNINSVAQVMIQVSNGANVALWSKSGTGLGIDSLNYSMSASAGFTAPAGSFVDAAGGAANSHTITMNTSTPGAKSGTLTITSDDPDAPTLVINLSGVVGSLFDYDVDNDGLVNIQDLYRWYGLFTDVDANGTVDATDLAVLRGELRRTEIDDMKFGRR